jgi:hypothetical protein
MDFNHKILIGSSVEWMRVILRCERFHGFQRQEKILLLKVPESIYWVLVIEVCITRPNKVVVYLNKLLLGRENTIVRYESRLMYLQRRPFCRRISHEPITPPNQVSPTNFEDSKEDQSSVEVRYVRHAEGFQRHGVAMTSPTEDLLRNPVFHFAIDIAYHSQSREPLK